MVDGRLVQGLVIGGASPKYFLEGTSKPLAPFTEGLRRVDSLPLRIRFDLDVERQLPWAIGSFIRTKRARQLGHAGIIL
jgi:hypothetical protein